MEAIQESALLKTFLKAFLTEERDLFIVDALLVDALCVCVCVFSPFWVISSRTEQ